MLLTKCSVALFFILTSIVITGRSTYADPTAENDYLGKVCTGR